MLWIHFLMVSFISPSIMIKSSCDCTRNALESHKIPYSVIVREVEEWSRIRIQEWITSKTQSVLPIGRLNRNSKFQWNQPITFEVILHTEWETDCTDCITSAKCVVWHKIQMHGFEEKCTNNTSVPPVSLSNAWFSMHSNWAFWHIPHRLCCWKLSVAERPCTASCHWIFCGVIRNETVDKG